MVRSASNNWDGHNFQLKIHEQWQKEIESDFVLVLHGKNMAMSFMMNLIDDIVMMISFDH